MPSADAARRVDRWKRAAGVANPGLERDASAGSSTRRRPPPPARASRARRRARRRARDATPAEYVAAVDRPRTRRRALRRSSTNACSWTGRSARARGTATPSRASDRAAAAARARGGADAERDATLRAEARAAREKMHPDGPRWPDSTSAGARDGVAVASDRAAAVARASCARRGRDATLRMGARSARKISSRRP